VPFTLAHPAAVLPLRGVRYLRSAPLVLGAMVPDTPYFVPNKFTHFWPMPETHSLAGSVSTDLLLAYAALLALFVLRAPLTALMTARSRWLCLAALAPFSHRPLEWLLAPIAIVLGVWTHLAWDSFTHPEGWMVERIAALNAPIVIGPYQGHVYHVLQYLSSVFGLVVIALWYRRLPTPRTAPAPREAPRSAVGPVLLLIATASILVGGVQATRHFLDNPFGQGTVYRTLAILLTHSLAWFALLYLLAGILVTLERAHERVSQDGA
jgi:Domain of unknown function (DUF4184)